MAVRRGRSRCRAGGWNSDLQTPPIQVLKDVKDCVLYERKLVMPAEAAGQAVELRFGAVNYGCEVFLDGRKVGEHRGPQVAFTVDLTTAAVAGKEQTLQVKAFHRRIITGNLWLTTKAKKGPPQRCPSGLISREAVIRPPSPRRRL